MSSPQPSARSPRIFIALAIVAVVAYVLAPGIAGDWGRDDYFQLAFVRLVGSPWPLFVHDHFAPVPGSVFRPLGFASMWLGFELFGTDYAAHAWSGIALHALAALALHALLRGARIGEPAALLATLVFALHPAATGTALWWSARFDVLAALFTFIALRAAIAYRDNGALLALVLALAAAFAAALSKEVGLVATAALLAVWSHWAIAEPAQRRRAFGAIAAACACAAGYFVWRAVVLGTPASGLTGALPLGEVIAKGIGDGVRQMPAYITFWPRLEWPGRVLAVLVVLLPLAVFVFGRERRRSDIALLTCGACVLLLPLLLQAPVAALNARPLERGQSVVEAAMQSRLYYSGLGGLAMILAVALERAWRDRAMLRRAAVGMLFAIAGIALASMSRDGARAFAERTAYNARLAHAAVAAVDALDLPPPPCHVMFIGVDPPPEWSGYVSMDAIVKALDADHARSDRCWFHADYPTWFFLQPSPTRPADAAPYPPLRVDGRDVPWLQVGTATFAYLQAPARIDAADRAHFRYLRRNGARFDDVTDDVAQGRLPAGVDGP